MTAPYYLTITVPASAVAILAPRGWELESATPDGRAIVRKIATREIVGTMVLDELAHATEDRGPNGPRKPRPRDRNEGGTTRAEHQEEADEPAQAPQEEERASNHRQRAA